MKKFEYKTMAFTVMDPPDDILKELNRLGEEGWEIISFSEFTKGGLEQYFAAQLFYDSALTSGFLVIMKREKTK